jgi:surface polysaccharide O-acyltransferase-like enzyme
MKQQVVIEKKERIAYVDLLRIAAIFGVIIIHVSASGWNNAPVGYYNWVIISLYYYLTRWTVPAFIMISGIFHLAPSSPNSVIEKTEFKYEIKIIFNKVFHFIGIIIFWGIFYNLVYHVRKIIVFRMEVLTLHNILKIFDKIIFGPAWYHLWYLYMLIGLYLLTPIIRCFIGNSKQGLIKYYLVLFFFIGTCLPLCNIIFQNISIFHDREIYFHISELSGYAGYYIAGYYFANYEIEKKTKTWIYIFAILSMIFTIIGTTIISIYRNQVTTWLLGYILPNTMFMTIAIFLLFKDIFSNINLKYKKKIVNLSKNAFGIYLVHVFFITVFLKLKINIFIINPLVSIPLISILIMMISYIFIIGIRKIPILRDHII